MKRLLCITFIGLTFFTNAYATGVATKAVNSKAGGRVAAEQTLTIKRAYSSATKAEKTAGNMLVRDSGQFSNDDLKSAKVLSHNWFTQKGTKDVFIYVLKGGKPSFVIIAGLEDSSYQYVQYLPVDKASFVKLPRAGGNFPDLGITVKGKRQNLRWDGTRYIKR